MKLLIINGSPRAEGNTALVLKEMEPLFRAQGIETEIIQIGTQAIRGCVGCRVCREKGQCVFDDMVNETAEKLKQADGLLIATPVYYAGMNGTLKALLDRLFYSASYDLTMKVGAGFAVARRGGLTATYDSIHKYFGVSGMPIATSNYWNGVHGRDKGEAAEDAEGLQTVRVLARNMAFLMKSIALGKEQLGLPEQEEKISTNFVR